MEANRNAYLVKNIIIFTLTIVATKLITFLLVPIYTRYMDPTEFGIVDLLFSVGSFLIPLITFNISDAVYRFSMDKESKTNKITSIIGTILIIAILEALLIIPILSFFPNYSKYNFYYYIYIVTSAISQVLSANLKGQEKLKNLSICNTLFTILVGVFNIIFLIVLKMKIEGYFIAFILANIITAIYSYICGNVYNDLKKFEFDKKLFITMLKYSIVLVPTSFMWWIINSSDRIMISSMISDAANGIYAVAYKIPSFFITILSIFNNAWVFSAIKEKDEKDNEEYSNMIYSRFSFITFVFAIIILSFIKPFLKIYVSNNFFVAWNYIPPLLVGGVFLTLSNFLATFYTANKDSKGLLYSATIGAIANIILNIILIPIMGIMGAAIATCISYIIVFIYRYFNVRKYVKIFFNYEYLLYVIFLIFSIILIYINSNIAIFLQIILLIFIIIFFKNKFLLLVNNIYNLVKNRFIKKNNKI